MTDTQLYMAVGLPVIVIMLGMLMNALVFYSLNARMNQLDMRMNQLENRMQHLDTKFDARFDLIMSKLIDVDNRLIGLEH